MPLMGAKELRETIQAAKRDAPVALGNALYSEAVNIIGAADPNVPYEFGHLRRSHFVELPVQDPTGPSVEYGYGAGFGLYVHEIPANHPKGGTDHWLRDEVVKALPGMDQRLAARMDDHPRGRPADVGAVPSQRPDPMEAIRAEAADRKRARARDRSRSIRAQNASRRRR